MKNPARARLAPPVMVPPGWRDGGDGPRGRAGTTRCLGASPRAPPLVLPLLRRSDLEFHDLALGPCSF